MGRLNRLIVLTGFEPFADFKVNPSWEAAEAFDGKELDSFKVKSFKIPLKYREIKPTIEGILVSQEPTALISLGQSYRPVVSLEKVAVNFADLTESNVLYNCGSRPKDEILEPKAPVAYFATLPIRELLSKLRESSIPTEISYDAGTFGCNQLFFHMMHKIHVDGLNIPAGFIHVPCLPSQTVQLQEAKRGPLPSMELERIIKAIEIAIRVTAKNAKQ